MSFPEDYADRVYAGVLGKIIGVYVGRPVEQWSHERIMETVGEVWYYVHEQLGKGLVVPDDDISGTFTFLRALEDYGYPAQIEPEQIGRTWLNYLVERRTVLWWGGLGTSTEHTAYLRLKHGIMPPRSGAAETNSRVVAEQIGAQIFIDGWGLICPGEPERAADLARRAGCVSHDGEAIYGAQVVAALVAQAFVEDDMDALLDAAVTQIPADSTIRQVIADVREWADLDGDWRKTLARVRQHYGYERFGGGCHIVPNHALIILALTCSPDDFQRALMIGTTSGYDTDCNVGNIGCIMGVKLGLDGIDAGPDWRGPVADRMYLPCADGGRVVTDAVREADAVLRTAHALRSRDYEPPKGGARYHFERPGSVQGFRPEDSAACRGTATVENVAGHSRDGARSLALRYHAVAPGRAARVATATFLSPDRLKTHGGYGLMASPTLHPGQTLRGRLSAGRDCAGQAECSVYVRASGAGNEPRLFRGPSWRPTPGAEWEFEWRVDVPSGMPILEVGVEVASPGRADGVLYLDRLDWDGTPDVTLGPAEEESTAWQRAWVDATDRSAFRSGRYPYRVTQNEGRGMLIQGTPRWSGYRVETRLRAHMADAVGVAAGVQGLRRYYALLLRRGGRVELVRALDGETVLASAELGWQFDSEYELSLEVKDGALCGMVDGETLLETHDEALPCGAVGLVCQEGTVEFGAVTVAPA